MQPETERRLIQLVDDSNRTMLRFAEVLDNLNRNFARFSDTSELKGHVIRHDVQLEQLTRQIEDTEEEVERTGSIYLDDVKKKVASFESSQAHWVRYVIAVVVSVALLGLSSYIGYLSHK